MENQIMDTMDTTAKNNGRPYVKIIEQPLSRGARFRYECEGRYSGSILGVSSTTTKRTYPTIEIVNYKGPAYVVVSCVTKDSPYRPHPHNLVGKSKVVSNGICHFVVSPNLNPIQFPNLGIQCVKKKDIDASLTKREEGKVDPFRTGFSHKYQTENFDLTSVRLCFQVFLHNPVENRLNIPLEPVVSNPIYDKKAAAELSISWVSHASASVAGGKVMCILCEKVTKDDIQVRFFSEVNGWEAIAETTSPHFHKQVAVVLKTPKYFNQDVEEPVLVHIQLRRPSDGEISKSIPFQLIPLELEDRDFFRRKRQKFNETPKNFVLRQLQSDVAKNTKLVNFTTQTDSGIVKVEPWNLAPQPVQSVAPKVPPYFFPQINNDLNTYSNNEGPLVNNDVPNNLHDFGAQLMQTNNMPDQINYTAPNTYTWQNPKLHNTLAPTLQKENPTDSLNFELQSLQRNHNEPRIPSNNSYMEDLLSSIIDENFPDNLSITEEL